MRFQRVCISMAIILTGYILFSPAFGYTAGDYSKAGKQLYDAKNYDQAIRYFTAALQMDPNNTAALRGRADCYYAQGQYSQALSDYQQVQSLQPSPQLASLIQALQAKLGTGLSPSAPVGNALPGIPAEPSLPPDLPSPANKASAPSLKKMELVLGLGGSFVVNGVYGEDYFANPTSFIPPGGPGEDQYGYGGEAEFYFSISSRFSIGLDLENYLYHTGVTDVINQNNLMLLGSAKWFLGGADTKPYLEGGLGCTYMTLSGVFSQTFTPSAYSSGPLITQNLPAVSFLCPAAQIGFGLEVPIGQDTDFCVQAKCRIFIFGNQQQTVTQGSFTLARYFGTSFDNPAIDIPLTAGLAFHL